MKVVIGALAGLLIGVLGGFFLRPIVIIPVLENESSERDTQVMEAIAREQQVVLLSLGIQGLHDKEANSELWGVDVPWSDRTSILEYSFLAKLGIDGADVTITATGDDTFLIRIPEFVFIGHQNEEFRVATQAGGGLSWITPELDDAELISEILDGDAQHEYIQLNRDLLEEQAAVFYRSIVEGIDPGLVVDFEFTD